MTKNVEKNEIKSGKVGTIILSILNAVLVFLLSFLIYFRVSFFIAYVSGSSMDPTLYGGVLCGLKENGERVYKGGDYLFAKKNKTPERFSVVVIEDVKEYGIIKRIIGLPGEEVELKDGAVYINGEKLDESSFLDERVRTDAKSSETKWMLKEDEYFYLGDNRHDSEDSTVHGPCKKENIKGVVSEWSIKNKKKITKVISIFRKDGDIS
ncbi:MAG: signal peptidase I [Clostridia bacterium]|nr:signal peptidase I [Clostridia bacterium]